MREQLSKLEGQLENLFEGSLAKLVGEEISAGTLASQLARTMEDGLRRDDAGNAFAPNEFALTLNPQDASRLVEHAPDIQALLSNDVAQAAQRCGYSLTHQPSITLASDPTLEPKEVRVISWHSSNPLEFTKAMEQQPLEAEVQLPEGAFLILGDGRHFALDKPVINVGRRIDNQIVLEDAHVSRTHAQLRVRDTSVCSFRSRFDRRNQCEWPSGETAHSSPWRCHYDR